jgi:hypothetical protein
VRGAALPLPRPLPLPLPRPRPPDLTLPRCDAQLLSSSAELNIFTAAASPMRAPSPSYLPYACIFTVEASRMQGRLPL